MPTYEYRCPQGHTFELFQRMADLPPEGCEVCGEGPLVKVLYPAAIHFKGSGFYSTDYGRGGRRKTGKDGEGGGGSDDSGAASEPKKPDKPEPKAAEA